MDILQTPVSECAFHNKTGHKLGVCSGHEGIEIMKKILKTLGVSHSNDPKTILLKTKEKLNCDSESCVINKDEFKNIHGNIKDLKERDFKPSGPWENDDWLSNFNIDEVLEQWAKTYPNFLHIPFQMRDFAEKRTEMHTIDLNSEYQKGMKSFGVVINTDYSTGSGIHWFAIFGDFSNKNNVTIEYFNSSGSLPLAEIQDWLYKTKLELEAHGMKVKIIIVTRIEHQKSNSECGVFSLWYIYSRLNKVPYSYFDKQGAITDDMMYQFRNHLYRKYK